MNPVRGVLASCALTLVWSTACRSGATPSFDGDRAPTASDRARLSPMPIEPSPLVPTDADQGSAKLDDSGTSPSVIGHFRTRLGTWEIRSTSEGLRYSLSDHRGSLLAEDLTRADVEALDPIFEETLQTGLAGNSRPLYAECYEHAAESRAIEIEAPGLGTEGAAAGGASASFESR